MAPSAGGLSALHLIAARVGARGLQFHADSRGFANTVAVACADHSRDTLNPPMLEDAGRALWFDAKRDIART